MIYRNQHEASDKQRSDLLFQLVNISTSDLSSQLVNDFQSKLMAVKEAETADLDVLVDQLEQVNERLFVDMKSQTETLRHELHTFEALGPRPNWAMLLNALENMLRDPALIDLFRFAGGMKANLEHSLRVLTSHGLEYASQLSEARTKLQRIQSCLLLKEVLIAEGKGDLLNRLRVNCKYYSYCIYFDIM